MLVVKFGGSSVRKMFWEAVNFTKRLADEKEVAVVVSALKGVTDILDSYARSGNSEIARGVVGDYIIFAEKYGLSPESIRNLADNLFSAFSKSFPSEEARRDYILSFGELMSAVLFAEAVGGVVVNPWEVIATDGKFGDANADMGKTKALFKPVRELIEEGEIPVIPGFIGGFNGFITTLGRGGSDYTAVIAGAALRAHFVLIMSDVEGIFTADPRIVLDAKLIPFVSYEEALLASLYGLKAIHHKAVKLAREEKLLILFGSTENWRMGTLIGESSSGMPIITHSGGKLLIINEKLALPYEVVEEGEMWILYKVPTNKASSAVRTAHRIVLSKYRADPLSIAVWG
ncbi:aspartate kinase [Thermococcus sp. M39]|uniref:aspartate kinase n=1 Tax=unclassified Thermococcus TaxID=2627626 RepID=UPI001438CC63|nr:MULTISPECIES: aspartate kinase [unclassified Thermococcus]NJE09176.1 aspartate kinase [Thermococcus sp. M39]NJE13095.1 aspartate kinase [Thermococcus sp. LS2]